LSPDGRLLAVQCGGVALEVFETAAGGRTIGTTPVGRFHHNLQVELGERWLAIIIESTTHLLYWDEELCADCAREPLGDLLEATLGTRQSGVKAMSGRLPGFLDFDPTRFRLTAWTNLIAVVSINGEVFLFEQSGDPVAAFFVFRHLLGGFLPDG